MRYFFVRGSICVAVLLLVTLGSGFSYAQATPERRPKIGLALSGGGARGFAHIGVLKVLEEARIPVDMIAGTSMGSVVGGLYALGYSPSELEQTVTTIDWPELFRSTPPRKTLFFEQKKQDSRFLLDIGLRGGIPEIPSGLSAGEKIANLFSLLTVSAARAQTFDQLPIPFRAIATDIVSGTQVILDGSQLSLAESLRASMAVPLVFTPVELGEQLLVDGGLVKNLPVDVVRQMGADIVIAVDVSAPLRNKADLQSLVAIMDQTISLQIVQSTQRQIAQADMVITPDLAGFSSADFSQAPALIAKGETAMQAQIARLQQLLSSQHPGQPVTARPRTPHAKDVLTVENVIIEGNVGARELSLLTAVGIKKGETLNTSELQQRIENIFGVGFFESVRFGVERGPHGGDVLRIHVKERDLNLLRLGFRYNDKEKSVGLMGLTMQPWTDKSRLLSAEVQVGGVLDLQASYLQYRLLETNWFFRTRAFYRDDFQLIYEKQNKTGEFNQGAGGFDATVGNTFRNFGEVTARYQWKRVVFTPDANGRNLPRFRGNIAALSVGSRLDTLDAFPFPTSGSLVRLMYDLADTGLGSETNFSRVLASYRQYFSPLARHTLFVNAYVGTSLGTGLPVSEEFLFGGPDSFLGYAREELRGDHVGVLGAGYRYKLFDLPAGLGRGVYGSLTFNTGNIWQSLDDLKDKFSFRTGGGVGLALDSIIGPIALDYGAGSGGRHAFYFSAGVPF
jgi:NTE family protein